MRRANYSFEIIDGVLCIEDIGPHNQFLTVTSDIENVLEDIKKKVELPEIIIYRDSIDMWDGIEYDENGRVSFYPLQTDDRAKAIKIAYSEQVRYTIPPSIS